MRFHRALVAGSLWASLLVTSVASGQQAVDIIRNAKAATALVVLPGGKGYASAFCIDPAGFFVTNVHVVHDLTPGQRVSLVLHSGEDAETVISAEPIRQDPVSDLALLKAEGFKQLTPLAIGSAATLTETQQVTAFGYPFGKMLSMDKKSYPSISVNVARVSSLRRQKGTLELVQLDSQLNPGNSGGPVIDAKGKVIGVISSGVLASGINFAVPAEKLLALVEKPEVVFTPPQIADAKRSDPVTLTIQTVCIGRPAPDMTVDVTLTTPDGAARTFPARASGHDAWTVSVVPVPAKPAATRFPAVVTFPDSSLNCSVDDVIVRLDGKPFRLSQISRIDTHDGVSTFTLVDHTAVSGAAQSVPMFKANVGGTTMPIDVARLLSVVFEQPSPVTSVTYRITAKAKGAVVSEATGVLFGDALAAATAAASASSPASNTGVAVGNSKPADGGPMASADYCTLLYVPKLQEILALDPSQRTKCEEMSRKMDATLERAVNDPHVPAIAMTADTMVRRAKGVLDRQGQAVHDLLTPQQDQQLAGYFAAGQLKPIEVKPLAASNTKSHLPPHLTGSHAAAGVLIVYSQFNDRAGPIAAAGPDLPAAAQTPAALPAGAVTVAAGTSVDLMPHINLARDKDSGEWRALDGGVINVKPKNGSSKQLSRLTVPAMPTGDYQVDFTFIRRDGQAEMCVFFPVAGHGAQISLGGFFGDSVRGTNSTGRRDLTRIVNDMPVKFSLTVQGSPQAAKISLKLNDVPHLSWQGPVTDLQVDPAVCTHDGRTLGLSVHQSSVFELRDMKVRGLSGTINVLGGGEPAAAPAVAAAGAPSAPVAGSPAKPRTSGAVASTPATAAPAAAAPITPAPPILGAGTSTTPAPGIRVDSHLSRDEREALKDVNSAADAVRLLNSGAQERRVAQYWLATSRIDLAQRAAVLAALKPLMNETDGKKRLPIVQAFEHWADAAHAADLAAVIEFPAQVQGISHQETCWAVALAGLVRVAPGQAQRAMNSRIDSLFFRSDATKALQPIADADCPQKELAKILIEELHNHH